MQLALKYFLCFSWRFMFTVKTAYLSELEIWLSSKMFSIHLNSSGGWLTAFLLVPFYPAEKSILGHP